MGKMRASDGLLSFETSDETRWFPFESEGLEVCIRTLLQEEFNALIMTSQRRQRGARRQRMEADLNKMDREAVAKALVNWRGLTGALFCRYARVKVESIARHYGKTVDEILHAQIEYDPETASYMANRCPGFADAIYDMARELVEDEGVLTKNSPAVSSGS